MPLSEREYSAMKSAWIKEAVRLPDAQARSDFQHFVDWCRFYDLPMPAGGDEVADYLLEMVQSGAPLRDVERVALSIDAVYEHRRFHLDRGPIKAAIAMAAEMLADRKIH
jgi:hypothetical protein